MNREVLLGTLFYTLASFSLFIFFFNAGFKTHFFLALLLFLFLSVSFGYIISSYLLSQKKEGDQNLLHLSKEILHELNIPLATIKANSSLLKRSLKEDPKGLKRLSRIDDASLRLERLYRELVYGIKKEIHPIEKETFALDVLIEEHIDGFRLMQRNPFFLELRPVSIMVDRIGFEKVIDNIISNAMKYSNKESEIVILLFENELIFKDHGVGMDETELLRIFERYYQLDHKKSGEGIGLALVKSYCDSEGIDIVIDSQKGLGTNVILDLTNVTV